MKRITKRKDPNYMKIFDWGRKNEWPSLDTVYYPRKWNDNDKALYKELLERKQRRIENG